MKRYSAEPTQVKKDTAGTADPSLPSAKDATHGEKSHQEDADTAETYTHTEAVSPAEPEVPGNTATPPAPEADPQAHPPKTLPHNDKELAALAEAREKREMLEEYLATVQADLTNSASREAERKKAIYEEVKRLNSLSAEEQQAYTISENLYRVSGFDEISNACNPGYGGAVDDAFFESGNMS